jgi:hypothetical protein
MRHKPLLGRTLPGRRLGHQLQPGGAQLKMLRNRRGDEPVFPIAHPEFIHPDDVARFRELGVVADASPVPWFPSPMNDIIAMQVHDHYIDQIWPLRELHDTWLAGRSVNDATARTEAGARRRQATAGVGRTLRPTPAAHTTAFVYDLRGPDLAQAAVAGVDVGQGSVGGGCSGDAQALA